MSYAPYPAYKDSGVPWLGQVPEGWDVKRLRYASKLADERLPYDEVQRPYVGLEHIVSWTGKRIVDDEARADGIVALFERGDVLFGKLRPYLAKVHRAEEAGCSSTEALILKGRPGLDTHFLKYFMLSPAFIDEVNATTYGTKMPRANWSDVGGLPVSLPPVEEQTAIANFLDEKTAEIDDLIAKKEELLRLLAEQRTALITHAVTKGLNPNAPMKPSGIDWLGDVPEGWEVKPFKREVWYQEGPGIMAVDFRDEGVPLLRIRNLKPGKVELEGCNFLDHDMANGKWAHFQVEEGDRLISTSASTGLVSVVDADAVGAIPYTGIIRIRPLTASLLPEFLEYFVSSELFFDQIELLATGTTIQHFGPYHLNQMVMAVPPVQEQGRLIETLASDLAKISETKGMVEIALDRLKEYRTALITNAVTGKIKVV